MPNALATLGIVGVLVGAVAAVATICYDRYQRWQEEREREQHRNNRNHFRPPSPQTPPRQRRPFCLVCQGALAGEDPIFQIRNCEHIFHVRCLNQLDVRRCPFPGCGREFPPLPMSPPASRPSTPPRSPPRERRQVCSFCNELLGDTILTHRLPICRHIFHTACLMEVEARRCPVQGCGAPLLSYN